ncbi:TonB-dependent receptor [Cytophagales bacterium WSM2-2]|nr:TonB-dependent receptor [Cytophagales bacterium WSM2-2]
MRFVTIGIALLFSQALSAQIKKDSSTLHQLDEIVVTATRNERSLATLPVPVTLVTQAQIKTMGSLRLTDVLNEQTGLVSVPQVSGFGNGLQLQGFDPDYTLILIDGEPLVGRTSGSLDLSRVTVGNIKQIEIVKGPSSSLYGSDALAGVVNIITERPQGIRSNVYTRYGSNNTLDLSGDFGIQKEKIGIYVFGNRFSTDGYSLVPGAGKTVSPFDNYTFNSKINFKISERTKLNLSGRYFSESQSSQNTIDSVTSSGTGAVQDWNINPVLTHRFSKQLKATARYYTTRYQTDSETHNTADGSSISDDHFTQNFQRPELSAEYIFNARNILTAGAGSIHETVKTNRYGDQNERVQDTHYLFVQHEWEPLRKLALVIGGRFDHNSIYGSQFSPKFSFINTLSPKVSIRGTVGMGFKSPDFRQLYLNFTNTAAGGYSVFGTEVAKEKLKEMDENGQIGSYLADPSKIGDLKAERSISFNLGAKINVRENFFAEINLFRNNVHNLINYYEVAVTTDLKAIYSYQNVNRIYTEGLEANFTYIIFPGLSASAGYQLLYARDEDMIESIKKGDVFWRDPSTLISYKLKPGDYFGLYNRSRHSGNLKIFYENKAKGYSTSLRVIYRGKYGLGNSYGNASGFTSGNNGNSILDIHDNFVSGYALVNFSVAKTFLNTVRIQAGIDNLLNHTDPSAIPNLPGRLIYGSLSYTLMKKNSH